MNVFYKRVSEASITPKHMCLAYRDWYKRQAVMVLFPFHYLVMFTWWLNGKWCSYKHKSSWIDKQVEMRNKKIDEVIRR